MDGHSPIELKIHNLENEMLESSRRILSLSQEAEDRGSETLATLASQSESLGRIDRDMNSIHENMSFAQRHLSQLRKFCGLCVCCSGRRVVKDSGVWSTKVQYTKAITDQPKFRRKSVFVDTSRGDAVETNLNRAGDIVHNLKNMANDMNVELDKQNQKIDLIIKKGEDNEKRIDWARKQTYDLI